MNKERLDNQPITVTLTGSAGNIGYILAFMIGQGKLLGNKKIILKLLEIPPMKNKNIALREELMDGSFEVLEEIVATTDPAVGFKDAELILLVGCKPRSKGMLRAQLIKSNAPIFKSQAKFIDQYANPNARVVVVGNPANTNALILANYSQKLKKENITSLQRLDINRIKAQLH